MNRKELERLAALLFGRAADGAPKHGWQAALASRLPGKSGGTLRRETIGLWMRDDAVPAWAAELIQNMAAIAPPLDSIVEGDRDHACAMAIGPELKRIRNQAVAAGWHPAEIAAAILSLTVDEIRHRAGDTAAVEILRVATRQISDNLE